MRSGESTRRNLLPFKQDARLCMCYARVQVWLKLGVMGCLRALSVGNVYKVLVYSMDTYGT
jgi:hypothetical protein